MKKYLLLIMCVCTFSKLIAGGGGKNKKPNIIFILADDLGYGDVGFNGQKQIRTPHIDLLAKEGMNFTQFYSGASVCAPSRSALLSGYHTGHTYIRGNKEVQPEGQAPIPDSVYTYAEMLKKAGYKTAAFGKWGLGPVGSEGDPNRQGFDHFFGYNCQKLAHRYYPNHLWENNQKIVLESNQNLESPQEYAPDIIQEKTLAYLENASENDPFFLFVPFILPHAELLIPNDSIFTTYKGKFPEKPFLGNNYGKNALDGGYTSQLYPHAAFASMVTRMDVYVGQIMQKLKDKGIDENTLVIFTSDNGPHVEGGADPLFFNSAGGFRGTKRDLYEGGIRVPFVVRWPKVIKTNSTNQHIGAFWDVFPTFAELAGIEVSEQLDGISFLNTLTGNGKQRKHDYLYWEFHELGGRQAVRQNNWKAIRLQAATHTPKSIELYDLSKDPEETNNVAAQYPEQVKKMKALMESARVPSKLFPFGKE
jgi:arylsulfatase A